jgi:hypothetical protein
MIKHIFSPLSFVTVFGSEIRDPGSGMGKNQDPGSGIDIPDPPHWDVAAFELFFAIHFYLSFVYNIYTVII